MKLSIALIIAASGAPFGAVGAPSFTFNDAKFKELVGNLEDYAVDFATHMESLYERRCTEALDGCANSNYDQCLSQLPDQTCPGGVNLNVPSCGDGVSCSGRYSFTTSTVRIPDFLAIGQDGNPTDPQVIETICFTKGMDDYLKSKLQQDKEYWNDVGYEPRAMYFGSHSGVFRIYPGRRSESCGTYDPTIRPWYVAASSGPKNVVMILDTSRSMAGRQLEQLKKAATRVVNTLTIGDHITIVPFSSGASPITNNGHMYTATKKNKEILLEKINKLKAEGGTDFYQAFKAAFDVVDASVPNDATVPCNTAVLFLTDGLHNTQDHTDEDVIELVQARLSTTRELLNGKPIFLFTYSLSDGKEEIDSFPSRLACATENGVWSKIDNENIVESLSSYQKLFALGLGSDVNKDFVSWVEPYKFATGDVEGTTVSVPVYDRSKEPPLFVGVVGIDFAQAALDDALGVEGGSTAEERREEAIELLAHRAVARCPVLELTPCELEAYRGDAARCSDNCTEEELVQVEEKKCPDISEYPLNLWHNLLDLGTSYHESVCCSVGDEQGGTCPAGGMPTWAKIVTPIGGFAVLAFCFSLWWYRGYLCQCCSAQPLPVKPIYPDEMVSYNASAPMNPDFRPPEGSSTSSDTEAGPGTPSSNTSSEVDKKVGADAPTPVEDSDSDSE